MPGWEMERLKMWRVSPGQSDAKWCAVSGAEMRKVRVCEVSERHPSEAMKKRE